MNVGKTYGVTTFLLPIRADNMQMHRWISSTKQNICTSAPENFARYPHTLYRIRHNNLDGIQKGVPACKRGIVLEFIDL